MSIDPEELNWEEVEVHEGREVGMLWRDTLTTYNLRILAPPVPYEDRDHVHRETQEDKRILEKLPKQLDIIEEELERVLPEGYQVRITEWDK